MAAVTGELEQIRAQAGPYPSDLLDGCESGLLLFAGGFHGRNDGIWFADAGMWATCVDIRPGGLEAMEAVYPDDWEYVVEDVFQFAEQAFAKWDVVSVDPFTGMFDRCAELAHVWCRLATRAVVLGCGHETAVSAPEGWRITRMVQRSQFRGGVFWAVMEPTG